MTTPACPLRRLLGATAILLLVALTGVQSAQAGQQQYEPLSASVQASLQGAVSDRAPRQPIFASHALRDHWLSEMSRQLAKRIPDERYRHDLLLSVHYEATRAGLDPQLVLGLIQVESNFRKYAVSSAGARGYMQIMPFWSKLLAQSEDNLFHLRTNLRYGCTILRHYLDIENGDLFRALGRYNGSLGKSDYPNKVHAAWQRWAYQPPPELITAANLSEARR
ncbi:lytic transglycosylase domain-containing protein [Zoogloeaceae bacterium G21618-S1]|nr:lytic transglycosylase domain-containing protein [Zoogloeaceae bacterium G21618-S1]